MYAVIDNHSAWELLWALHDTSNGLTGALRAPDRELYAALYSSKTRVPPELYQQVRDNISRSGPVYSTLDSPGSSASQRTLPDIDFTSNLLVVAAWGEKPYPSYRLNIKAITLKDGTLAVEVKQSYDKNCNLFGCIDMTMGTQPIEAVSIPRSEFVPGKYEVVFRETGLLFFPGGTLARSEINLP